MMELLQNQTGVHEATQRTAISENAAVPLMKRYREEMRFLEPRIQGLLEELESILTRTRATEEKYLLLKMPH